MPKEPTRRAEKSPAATPAAVEKLDRELLRLMNERARLAEQVAKAQGPTSTGELCAQVDQRLAILLEHHQGPLSAESVKAAFRELYSGTLALERPRRVAFLGPAYTYSHVATLHRFGHDVEQVPVATIPAVFEEVTRGHVDFGVVPVENSTDGRVADSLDMFARTPVRICGEVKLRIHHNLLGKGNRADITEVYSRPQALSQCRNWLAKHLPNARLIEVTSTSTAAQLAQDKPGAAAIAGVQAGRHYGLNLLVPNIEDSAANVTRFAVIGNETSIRTGHDRTTALFEVEHKPGGLADAINIFKRAKLNLTWIESFPRPEGGYMFFIELDGHETDARVKKAFAALAKKAQRLEVLGSFAKTEPVD